MIIVTLITTYISIQLLLFGIVIVAYSLTGIDSSEGIWEETKERSLQNALVGIILFPGLYAGYITTKQLHKED